MKTLFDIETVKRDYTNLSVSGFEKPVPGVVFTDENRPCCGVPLGGIGTGCIDFNVRGIFGWSTLFNPFSQILTTWENGRVPRRHPDIQPVFGFSLDNKSYVLATDEIIKGGKMPWCTAPAGGLNPEGELPQHYVDAPKIADVFPAASICYYGHYPIADAEYRFDAPVSVGIRAWSSFIPGDIANTNIPAAVFEVHIRNTSDEKLSGNFVMNFPGPDNQEARSSYFTKTRIEEKAKGLFVCSEGNVNYFVGVYDQDFVMTGTGLSENNEQEYGYGTGYYAKKSTWNVISRGLPQDDRFIESKGVRKYKDPSASVGVRFSLDGGDEKVYQFVLCWYAPIFDSTVRFEESSRKADYESDWHQEDCYGGQIHYAHMYAIRYNSALDVMRKMAKDRDTLLKKILAWQEVLLTRECIPAWLRDSLLNILCLLTEDGYWFMPKYPLGDWAFPGGAFTYYESPRDCPHSSCIPNDWIGTIHLSYMFPDLFLQLLRSYKGLQRENGEIPFAVGKCGDLPNLSQPEYTWQMSLNGTCYIMMVDRLWLITGNDDILRELYASVKACHNFMSTLAQKGWLCIPDRGGSEWFEYSKFYGYTSHVGGLHLSQLLIVERMARNLGDDAYADQCRREYEQARDLLQEKLWTGTHYLTWLDEDTGNKNNTVMAYQLDGIFTNAQAGITEKMYPDDRVKKVIDTIFKSNVKLGNGFGALNYAHADGSYLADDEDAYGKYNIFTQNTIVLAMTCMYCGQSDRGMELAESTWRNLVIRQGLGWDMTHQVHAKDGHKIFGSDYNQQSVIWSMLAAMEGKDISAPCKEGGIVSDMLKRIAEI